MKSIRNIAENHICTGCGGCAAVCPVRAITMEESPAGFLVASVGEECVQCGLCRKVCPSVAENTKAFAHDDLLHGSCLAAFTGYANNDAVRLKGQSGGVVTAVLCYLLETGRIQGALVNGFDPEKRRPKAAIVQTKEAVLASAGSYYTQSAVLPALREKKGRTLAAVTLGCQSASLELMKQVRPELLPEYTIGLICAGQNSGHMIDDICGHANFPGPTRFRFRDKTEGGWPGAITMDNDTASVTLPNQYRHSIKAVYECHRCLSCFDQMNTCADIVCGDPWGIAGKDGPEGCTVILVRTEKGLKLLKEAEAWGAVCLEELSMEELFRGQTVDDRHRDKVYAAKSVYKENGWLYPYDGAVLEDYVPTGRAMEKNREKLLYTRTYAQAPTQEAARRIAEKKKKEKPPLKVRLKKWLKQKKCCYR